MKKALKKLFELVLYILLIFSLGILLANFVVGTYRVSGSSMEPVLSGDEYVFSYKLGAINRGDIIFFENPYSPGEYYVKRVIGLPGENVLISENGEILINGEVFNDIYALGETRYRGILDVPMELSENEYCVLGDNRHDSLDSRYLRVGAVNKKYIVAKAKVVVYPLNKFRIL